MVNSCPHPTLTHARRSMAVRASPRGRGGGCDEAKGAPMIGAPLLRFAMRSGYSMVNSLSMPLKAWGVPSGSSVSGKKQTNM